MLVPFTKNVSSTGDGDDAANSDDEISDDEEDDKEVEVGREEFDDVAVEKAMEEVTQEFDVSDDQARVARPSLTKVRERVDIMSLILTCVLCTILAKATG